MLPDASSPEKIAGDWRIMLMVEVNTWIQQNPSLFVPIVWSWTSDDQKALQVTPLRDILKVKQEELPGLFAYNTNTNSVFRYPDSLDDAANISPELVMMWGKKVVVQGEIDALQKRLDDRSNESVKEEDKLNEEEANKILAHFEKMKPEVVQLEAAIAEMKELFKEHNPFADLVNEKDHHKQ